MKNCSTNSVILVRYPFSDLSGSKVRPAIVISAPHPSEDVMIVPLTSRTFGLMPGEFVLTHWKSAGLNVPSAVKRGIYTVSSRIIAAHVGCLKSDDAKALHASVDSWLF
jgi:mRNA interferase MazF